MVAAKAITALMNFILNAESCSLELLRIAVSDEVV